MNKIINSMMSSTDYVEWLRVFSQKYHDFVYSEYVRLDIYDFYKKSSVSDRMNIRNIQLFYQKIEELYPHQYETESSRTDFSRNFTHFYKIKYNDFCFKIGNINSRYLGDTVSEETFYFYEKMTLKKEDKFIDFNDIMALYKSKVANESTKEDIPVIEEKKVTEYIEEEEKTDDALEKETNNMKNELNKKTSKNKKLKSELSEKQRILKEIKEQIKLSESLKEQLEECDREYKRLTEEYESMKVKENGNKYGTK